MPSMSDHAHCASCVEAHAGQLEGDDRVQAETCRKGDRIVADHAHRDGHDAGDQGRSRSHPDWVEPKWRGDDVRVQEDDVGHDHEGGQPGPDLCAKRRPALAELEEGSDRFQLSPPSLRPSQRAGPSPLATELTAALAPFGTLSCLVRALAAVERAELHLDVIRRDRKGKTLLLGLVGVCSADGRELDHDALVSLNERVDDQLIGTGFELEMLEGIDVETDREGCEEGRHLGPVDDDALDPAGAVGDDRAPRK